jgi:hypothetical protein
MAQLDSIILRGHQKIIEHFRWLRDTASSNLERERFHRWMQEEERLLADFCQKRLLLARAASDSGQSILRPCERAGTK